MENTYISTAISKMKYFKGKLEELPKITKNPKAGAIPTPVMIEITALFLVIFNDENDNIKNSENHETLVPSNPLLHIGTLGQAKVVYKRDVELKIFSEFITSHIGALKIENLKPDSYLENVLATTFSHIINASQVVFASSPTLMNNINYQRITHSLFHAYHNSALSFYSNQEENSIQINELKLENSKLLGTIKSIESKHSQIEDMLLKATEHHFSKKFQERGADLDKPIKTWTRLLAASWVTIVCCIFLVLFQNHSPQDLLITSLKVLPLFALAVFCTSQYIKERNFKEEYEFKSILSLTMNPMREQISDPQIQDQITSKLVDMLYRSPLDSTNKVKTGNSDMEFAEKITNRLIDLLPTKSKD